MARIRTRQLARMCHRLGTALRAGMEIRQVLNREAASGVGTYSRQLAEVARRVERGATLAEAMRGSEGYLPDLLCDLVDVGEQTGQLESVLLRLADHYQHLLFLRRLFLGGIAFPMLQLLGGIVVIGGLILILGLLPNSTSTVFGLAGPRGLVIYALLVGGVLLGAGLAGWGLLRGWFGSWPAAVVMRLPVVGTSLKTMALARFCWTLSLTLNAGIDARRSLRLALDSTQNVCLMAGRDAAENIIARHGQFHEALRATAAFPADFLDALENAEITGTESESLDRLSHEYQERTQDSTRVLVTVATFAVWAMIAALFIFLIFSLVTNLYLRPIQEALEMTNP
jgi:type II secretory pathway component PulF